MTENYFSTYEDGKEVTSSKFRQQSTPPFYPEFVRSTAPNATSNMNQSGSHNRQRRRPRLAPSGYAVKTDNPAIISAMPPAIARDPRRKAAWLKARAQTARDRAHKQGFGGEIGEHPYTLEKQACHVANGPKRQQIAFVKEEELKCILDDQAGTPHISELQLDGDSVGLSSVEELGMRGKANALSSNGCEEQVVGRCKF